MKIAKIYCESVMRVYFTQLVDKTIIGDLFYEEIKKQQRDVHEEIKKQLAIQYEYELKNAELKNALVSCLKKSILNNTFLILEK
jgi:hypothetical protein